jgi:hypothetical protein
MKEAELKKEIASRGWEYNSVTRWLVETNTTPYKLSQLCGIDKSVVSRWVHNATLPAFVQWAFVAFEKMRLTSCANVLDCF